MSKSFNLVSFVKYRQNLIFMSRPPVFAILSVFRQKRNPLDPKCHSARVWQRHRMKRFVQWRDGAAKPELTDRSVYVAPTCFYRMRGFAHI